MTAGADLSVSVQAAAPTLSSQLLGSGLIGLREGLEAVAADTAAQPTPERSTT
jgi:hypothetical protein